MIDHQHISAPRTAMFHTFGCKLNFAETATVERLMAERGIERAADGVEPDFIIINSCSVTAEADRKCRNVIRSLHKRHPGATIMVTGCYAQLNPEKIMELEGVGAVVGTNDKLYLASLADSWNGLAPELPPVVEAKELTQFMPSCERGDRTRFFLKVQDGCDYWCTYCTIPKARGRSRSPEIQSLVTQAQEVAAAGGKEIVLTGVNIGDFGRRNGQSFLELCRALDAVEGIERYRISSIEPNLITEEIIEFVAGSRAFMPHFHIPLQSGSDQVLKLMNRRYDTDFFARKIESVRRMVPDAFIGVDLIVGARGETPDEFKRSVDFVQSLDISHLHVFPYSERPGTRALELAHAVPPELKKERAAIMGKISDDKHEAFARKFLGSVRTVLAEGNGKKGATAGFTDNYLRVSFPSNPLPENSLTPMLLDSLAGDRKTIIAAPAL